MAICPVGIRGVMMTTYRKVRTNLSVNKHIERKPLGHPHLCAAPNHQWSYILDGIYNPIRFGTQTGHTGLIDHSQLSLLSAGYSQERQ